MKKYTFLCMLVIACVFSGAQPGSLDSTFGTNGSVTGNVGQIDGGRSVAIQSDGKIILGGSVMFYYAPPWNTHFGLIRLNADGSFDNTFGTNGIVTTLFANGHTHAHAMALQSDGKIILAGYSMDSMAVNSEFAMARYNTDGSLDATFGNSGTLTTDLGGEDVANAVAVQSDGKIVVAGVSGSGNFALVRYNSDGSLDSGFGTGGIVITLGTTVPASAMVIQSDGKIVVTGGYGNVVLARYDSNGGLDNTFGSGGIVTSSIGTSSNLALQSDGKIVVVGGAGADFFVARFTSSGNLDNTFGAAGMVTTPFASPSSEAAYSVIIQSDGKIIAAGQTDLGNGSVFVGYFALARYDSFGNLDNTFGTGGLVTTDFSGVGTVFSLAIQGDGKIVAGGTNSSHYSGDFAVARYSNSAAPSGISESGIKDKIKIFPNPSSGIFTVQINKCAGEIRLCVRDVLGNCVLERSCGGETKQQIDLSAQPRGIYFIELLMGNEKFVSKVGVE